MNAPLAEDARMEILIGQIADAFTDQLQRGEQPTVEEYVSRHPELGEILRKVLTPIQVMCRSAAANGSSWARRLAGLQIPPSLGEYRILREVGRGGMGVVFEARQETLGRRVALKVLPTTPLTEPVFLERFRREARAAAGLHHTSIVPVFGVGEEHGLHYYAMQFIDGQALDEVLVALRQRRVAMSRESEEPNVDNSIRTGTQPPTDLADRPFDLRDKWQHPAQYFAAVGQLALQVADALAYAHRQGVLHRDIKPSNLLLDRQGLVWITDLGLAKIDAGSNLTQLGDVVGTLRYMAPERFAGRSDERSDVYSLGLTLYELLTLHPAFEDADRGRLIRRITQEEPVPPRKHDPRIPRDLETVVLKAIAKDPVDRYASAAALAEELRLLLADRPIAARRANVPERVWRWGRRNPAMAALTACVAALLLCVAVTSTAAAWLWRNERNAAVQNMQRAVRAEDEATAATELASRRLYDSLLAQARAGRASGMASQRFGGLAAIAEAAKRIPPDAADDARRELRSEAVACLAMSDLQIDRKWADDGPRAAHLRIDFDPAGERYAAFELSDQIFVRRVSDNAHLARLQLPHPAASYPYLRFSPSGEFLAAKWTRENESRVAIWHLARGEIIFTADAGGEWFCKDFAFSADSRRVAFTGADRAVRVHELATGREQTRIRFGLAPYHLSFSPDGQQLALALSGGQDEPASATIVDLAARKVVRSFSHPMLVSSVAWSPDAKRLATACYDSNAYVWDAQSGQQVAVCKGHRSKAIHVVFNHAGDLLASAAWDMTTRLWDPRSGEQLVQTDLWGVQFSHDDRWLSFAVPGVAVGRWEVAHGQECRVLVGHVKDSSVVGISFAPPSSLDSTGPVASRLLATASRYDGIRLWDVATGQTLAHMSKSATARSVLFDRDARSLVTADSDVLRWPIERADTEKSLNLRIGPPQPLVERSNRLNSVAAISATGEHLVSGALFDEFLVHRFDQPEQRWPLKNTESADWFPAISPQGEWVALGRKQSPGVVPVYDAQTGEPVAQIPAEGGSLTTFSPQGEWLVVSRLGEVVLHEVHTWRELRRIPLNSLEFSQVRFSPDAGLMAVASAGEVKLLDPQSGVAIVGLRPPREAQLAAPYPEGASAVEFSHDGSFLAAGSIDGLVFVWDLHRIRAQLAEMGLDWQSSPVPPTADQPLTPLRVEVRRAAGTNSAAGIADSFDPTLPAAFSSLQLDGIDDWARLPAFTLGGAITVEAWVRANNVRADYARIIDFGYGPSSNNIILGWEGRTGRMLWEIYNGGSSANLRLVTSREFPQDRWVHVAAVVEANGNAAIYWDGEAVASGRLLVPETATRAAQWIGRSNWSRNAYFQGRLADVRVWHVARSAAAIRADRWGTLSGNEPSLVGYWRFDETAGTTSTDRTRFARHARIQGGVWQPAKQSVESTD